MLLVERQKVAHLQADGVDSGTAYPMGESGRTLTPIGGPAPRNAGACALIGGHIPMFLATMRAHQYDWKALQPSGYNYQDIAPSPNGPVMTPSWCQKPSYIQIRCFELARIKIMDLVWPMSHSTSGRRITN
jgi:hypothetical protein